MATNTRVIVEVIANTKQFGPGLKSASRDVLRFSESVTRSTKRIDAERAALVKARRTLDDYRASKAQAAKAGALLGRNLAGVVAAGVGLTAIVATMRTLVVESTKAALAFQKIETRFTQFTKSQALTAEALGFVTEKSTELGLSLDSSRAAYARLLVLQDAGLLTTAQLRDLFIGFADAAAATGATTAQVEQSLFGLSQALASPIVRAEELNQVTEALPGILQAVDRALGLAAGGFRQLVVSGQVTNTFFRDSLTKGLQEFQGAAENLGAGAGGALNEIRAELQLTTETIGGNFTEALNNNRSAITGIIQAYRDFISAGSELKASIADDNSFGGLTEQVVKYRTELERIGQVSAASQIDTIWQRARLEVIGNNEALNQARQIYENITTTIKSQQDALANVRQAEINAFNVQRINAYKETLASSNDELKKAQTALKELERAEKSAADRIIQIRKELAGNTRSIEEEVADVRRSSLSEGARQASLELEIGRKIAEAARMAGDAKKAQTEEERKAALESAKAASDRARDLAGEVTNTDAKIRLLKRAGAAQSDVLNAEKSILEDQQSAREKDKQTLTQQITEIEAKAKNLQEVIDRLTDKDKTITLEAETEKAKKELEAIEKKLAQLSKGAVIPITTRSQGGSIPGLATGGRIPGYGGGDRVPAMLEAGEYVLRKEAVRRYGMGFIQQLNGMRFPSLPEPQKTRFATGGLAQRGDEVTLNLNLGSGQRARLRGGRDDVRVLTDALNQIARATA